MRYTIKSGDTLWDLARKYGVTVDDLLRLNPHITDRNKIYAGRTLNLPDAPVGVKAADAGSSPYAASFSATPAANLAEMGLVRPPLKSNPRLPNPVELDAAAAREGMDPGIMDPTQIALLGGPVAANVVMRAIPALAKAAPAALPAAGRVAPTVSNVMPIPGSQGAAAAMLNSHQAQLMGKSLPEAIQWYLQQQAGSLKNWGL